MNSLQDIREIALTVIAVSGAGGASGALLLIFWRLPGRATKWIDAWTAKRHAEAATTRALAEILPLIPAIRDEFKPNSGHSLRDLADRLANGLASLSELVAAHLEESKADRELLKQHVADGKAHAVPTEGV